jgi:cyanate permease
MLICLFSQIPDPSPVIEEARKSGWEAAFIVLIVLAFLALFVYVITRWQDESAARETRMNDQVTALQEDIRIKLYGQLNSSTSVMERMAATAEHMSVAAATMIEWCRSLQAELEMRPCLFATVGTSELAEELRRVIEAHGKRGDGA